MAFLQQRGYQADEIVESLLSYQAKDLDLHGHRGLKGYVARRLGEPIESRTTPVANVAGNLTIDAIIQAAWRAGELRQGTASRAGTARALHTSVPTLTRAMKALRMTWPPPPPPKIDPD